MIFDHAMRRFQSLVASAIYPVSPRWARSTTKVTYPWCFLQIVSGPTSLREQIKWVQPQQITLTVLSGTLGSQVAVLIGGRVLYTEHTGDAETTAGALAGQMPAHWTAERTLDTWVISGPDILGGFAYEGCTLSSADFGDPYRTEVMRRQALVQTTVWTEVTQARAAGDTGPAIARGPARWEPGGCDALALKIQTALRQVVPDPYRVYITPQAMIRPSDESYRDGHEYVSASFDSEVTWIDFDAIYRYGFDTPSGEPVGKIESVEGTIETSDGVSTWVDEFESGVE